MHQEGIPLPALDLDALVHEIRSDAETDQIAVGALDRMPPDRREHLSRLSRSTAGASTGGGTCPFPLPNTRSSRIANGTPFMECKHASLRKRVRTGALKATNSWGLALLFLLLSTSRLHFAPSSEP